MRAVLDTVTIRVAVCRRTECSALMAKTATWIAWVTPKSFFVMLSFQTQTPCYYGACWIWHSQNCAHHYTKDALGTDLIFFIFSKMMVGDCCDVPTRDLLNQSQSPVTTYVIDVVLHYRALFVMLLQFRLKLLEGKANSMFILHDAQRVLILPGFFTMLAAFQRTFLPSSGSLLLSQPHQVLTEIN